MSPCQGESRGSESRLPLHRKTHPITGWIFLWSGRRERTRLRKQAGGASFARYRAKPGGESKSEDTRYKLYIKAKRCLIGVEACSQNEYKGASSALFRLPSSVIYVGVNSLDGKSKEVRYLQPFSSFWILSQRLSTLFCGGHVLVSVHSLPK